MNTPTKLLLAVATTLSLASCLEDKSEVRTWHRADGGVTTMRTSGNGTYTQRYANNSQYQDEKTARVVLQLCWELIKKVAE